MFGEILFRSGPNHKARSHCYRAGYERTPLGGCLDRIRRVATPPQMREFAIVFRIYFLIRQVSRPPFEFFSGQHLRRSVRFDLRRSKNVFYAVIWPYFPWNICDMCDMCDAPNASPPIAMRFRHHIVDGWSNGMLPIQLSRKREPSNIPTISGAS